MPEYCQIDKSDHITTVALLKSERLNALHGPATWSLSKCSMPSPSSANPTGEGVDGVAPCRR